jgi:hypothetical protein
MKNTLLAGFVCLIIMVGQTFASDISMRINVPGSGCDHKPFGPGKLSATVLKATNGQGGDAIEIIKKPGGGRKAKRLHTKPNGWTYVYQWVGPDGSPGNCVQKRQKDIFVLEDLQQLLQPGETIGQNPAAANDIGKKQWGKVLTEGVYIIYKK